MIDILFLFLVFLCLVAFFGWYQEAQKNRILKHCVRVSTQEADRALKGWNDCFVKLGAAEKQVVKLGRQVPGRDKTGKFVKVRDSGSHGSE